MNPIRIAKKILGFEEIFTIGVGSPENKSFTACLPADDSWWYADPMPFEHDGRQYVFCEFFDRALCKGKLGVFEVSGDTLSNPRVILDEPFHLSYPAVYELKGSLYLLPECSASGEIRIYRCKAFPDEWELCFTQKCDGTLVDGNVISKDGKLYYLISRECGRLSTQLEISELMIDDAGFRPFCFVPCTAPSLSTRGAGCLWADGARRYRPSQRSKPDFYGYSVLVNEIVRVEPGSYAEKKVFELLPADLSFTNFERRRCLGIHTFSILNGKAFIDLKYEVWNPKKWAQRFSAARRK